MRMIYQPRVNRVSRRRRTFSVVVSFLAVLFVCLFSFTHFGVALSRSMHTVFTPVFRQMADAGALIDGVPLKSRATLLQENEELTQALTEAQVKLGAAQILVEENERLKNMLGRPHQGKLLVAAVLSKPNRSPYDTVLIDVGEQNGVLNGMLVLGYETIPIGHIAEVYKTTSLVRLFSSAGQTQEVEIGESHIAGRAEGQGGGNFKMLLPKDTPVKEGDTIRLPGLNVNFFGTVEKIERSDSETFSHILFKSPVNIYNLSRVFVVIPQ